MLILINHDNMFWPTWSSSGDTKNIYKILGKLIAILLIAILLITVLLIAILLSFSNFIKLKVAINRPIILY